MKTTRRHFRLLAASFVAILTACASPGASVDRSNAALPSWNDGPAKQAILEFVAAVTDEKDQDYVAPSERIAVFDNDGTL